MDTCFRVAGGFIELDLKVTPGASANRLQDIREGRLRVQIAAAPEHGRANAALISFLAKAFSVRKSDIRLKSGESSRLKTVVLPQSALEAVEGLSLRQFSH